VRLKPTNEIPTVEDAEFQTNSREVEARRASRCWTYWVGFRRTLVRLKRPSELAAKASDRFQTNSREVEAQVLLALVDQAVVSDELS